ncbi:competence protein CoiA family protein [Paenibacillus thalictri]|nr:competence protein CoiA family protein [Paenibacillus thalictri]
MSIKLAIALEDNKIFRHISERLDRSKSYTCPFCLAPVQSKKGQERQHHFAHLPGTSCSANEETLLHFNAKHYLAYCIKNKFDIAIHVPVEILPPKLKGTLLSLGIREYPLSLLSLTSFYKSRGAIVEKAIGPYIADVFMLLYDIDIQSGISEEGFVFEIVVTHEMEQEKQHWLIDNNINFLELAPRAFDDNTFSFRALRLHFPDYFSNLQTNLINTTAETFHQELTEVIKENIRLETDQKIEQSLKLKAWDWVVDRILYRDDLRTWVPDEIQREMKSITVKPFWDQEIRKVTMFGATYKKVREHRMVFALDESDREFLILNEKILLAELLKVLSVAYPAEMIIGKSLQGKEGVIGFSFHNVIDPINYEKEWKNSLKKVFDSVRNRLELGSEDKNGQNY